MIRKLCSVLSVLFLSLMLAGCGFHLRGPVLLAPPLKNLYIQSADPYSQLVLNLKQSLTLSGVSFATRPDEATTVLEILRDETSDQLSSVGTTQQTRQYTLTLIVTMQITTPSGKVLVPPTTMSKFQTITIQSNQVLGGSNEESNLYQQMRRDIIYSMMNWLSSQNVTSILMKSPVNY